MNPDAAKAPAPIIVTVDQVINLYVKGGYPDRDNQERSEGSHKDEEKRRCESLLGFFTGMDVALLKKPKTRTKYLKYRQKTVTKGEGSRTADLEMNTLSNAFNWAIHEELVDENPIFRRKKFRKSKDVIHCRERCPENADELHEVTGILFSARKSEVLAWQYLIESASGLRGGEVIQMKMNAHSDEPGGLTQDGGSLRVHHVKKRNYNNHFLTVTDDLKVILAAHKKWHDERYPGSEWYLPGNGGNGPISKGALTHRLDDLHKAGLTRKKFTSHGGRALYVLIRRSQGAPDNVIAWEINHKGTRTIEDVYGGVPEAWRLGKGPHYTWLPQKVPLAWTKIKPGK